MEGKPARHGGDREGEISCVIVVVGPCSIEMIFLICSGYFMGDFPLFLILLYMLFSSHIIISGFNLFRSTVTHEFYDTELD